MRSSKLTGPCIYKLLSGWHLLLYLSWCFVQYHGRQALCRVVLDLLLMKVLLAVNSFDSSSVASWVHLKQPS